MPPPHCIPFPRPGRKQSKTLHQPLSNLALLRNLSHPTRFLLMLLALLAFANLTRAAESKDVDSAIGTSSDMWATLVANIAPLLLLVGEKHVKAYFKTIRNPSHCLLYAVGPIGIITAITTLIRLTGIRTIKRLIGRQYESLPEVLADVTSISTGYVAVEIRNDRLEQLQTINSSTAGNDDIAIFYLRARKEGKYDDLHRLLYKAMLPIKYSCGGPKGSIPPEWLAVVGLFQTKIPMGNDNGIPAHESTMVREMRDLIRNDLFERRAIDRPDSGFGSDRRDITGFIEIFTGWEGISPSLTACFNGEEELTNGFRFMINVVCILGYIGIIIGNWFVQKNVQNTVLISLGLLISGTGAYYTANMVNSQSTEIRTKLDFMEGLRPVCGYYSSSGRYGRLKSCPKTIISSIKADHAGRARLLSSPNSELQASPANLDLERQGINLDLCRAWWVARPTVVLVAMTLAYVGLYLGLRTAEWWTSFSVLAISVVASVTRVLLVTDDQELKWKSMSDNPERIVATDHRELVSSDTYTPWPWASPDRMAEAHFMEYSIPSSGDLTKPLSTPPNATTNYNLGTDDSSINLNPQDTYTILTAQCQQVTSVNVGGKFGYDFLGESFFANLMHGSLLVAKELYSRSLIPEELGSIIRKVNPPQRSRSRQGGSSEHTQQRLVLDSKPSLFSHIIAQDGVWRQNLELVLNVSHSKSEICLNECSVYLGFWWLHAQKLRASWETACKINGTQIPTNNERADITQDNKEEDDEDYDLSYSAQYSHPPDDSPRMFRDYIWMGAKICFVLQLVKDDSRPQKTLQNLLHVINDKVPNLSLQEGEAKSIVNYMEEIGLAVPLVHEKVTSTRTTSRDSASK